MTEATIEEVLALTNGAGPDIITDFLANINLETDLKLNKFTVPIPFATCS
ncbi:hypothetical protein AB9M93_25360 [Peribacillus frigoritolerans]